MFIMFIQEVFALAIVMYHVQIVKYLNNHFYTMVLKYGIFTRRFKCVRVCLFFFYLVSMFLRRIKKCMF